MLGGGQPPPSFCFACFPHLAGRCTVPPMAIGIRTALMALGLFSSGVLLACGQIDTPVPPMPATPELAIRGQILANGLGACGHCHSMTGDPNEPLSGGRTMSDKFGDIQGPNITLAASGIGSWSEGDFIRTFRAYVKPNGGVVAPSFHSGVEWMSDVDLGALTTYIRSLPAVENEVPDREISWLDENTVGFFDSKSDVRGLVPQIPRAFRAEYGQYLVDHVAHCGSCHSQPEGIILSASYMSGGEEIYFDGEAKVAPDITSSPDSGLGEWSESDYKTFFATGRTRDGRQVDARFCPVRYYSRAAPEDIDAMVTYLRTIPAD